jgi:hypothetical protein
MPNRPGTLLSVLRAIADEDINILGTAADIRPGEQWGYLHLLVDDSDGAQRVIESVGFEVTSVHEVDVIELQDRPGAIFEAAGKYTESGQNIEVFYMAHESLVIGTDSMRKPIIGTRMKDARYP